MASTEKSFILGTAIKITILVTPPPGVTDVTGPVAITVVDPTSKTMISKVSMTREVPKVYSYIYQSSQNDNSGDYIVTVEATHNANVSVFQDSMSLVNRE